ncbi:MAG: transcriptional regulator [Bacteroidetes bacterium HGW-Bacteroidetes-7]|jgi:predicted DNA-binding transcriptional regulator YafY|nr:MAG: transcriptional regulator [Bacteroidetes bacterium HGW-Bacteroidetes-7]
MDQPKLERLLRIMQLMTDKNRKYNIGELSVILDISPRSVYRYIDTFESVGFIVNKDGGKVWFAKESKHFKTIADLVYFTEEEAYILKRAIESIDGANPAIAGIKSKLYSIYDFKRVAEVVVHPGQSRVVNAILDSIACENQVILKNYRSAHSAAISDRLVEPIGFGINMVDVLCYEVASDSCKFYKVSRIEEVVPTGNSYRFREKHKSIKTDLFRFSGTEQLPVKLRLSMLAANLLMEEFPLSEKRINKISDNEYIFEDYVCSFEGVGRFVLGLCNEIEVVESNDFMKFLNKKRENSKF